MTQQAEDLRKVEQMLADLRALRDAQPHNVIRANINPVIDRLESLVATMQQWTPSARQ